MAQLAAVQCSVNSDCFLLTLVAVKPADEEAAEEAEGH